MYLSALYTKIKRKSNFAPVSTVNFESSTEAQEPLSIVCISARSGIRKNYSSRPGSPGNNEGAGARLEKVL